MQQRIIGAYKYVEQFRVKAVGEPSGPSKISLRKSAFLTKKGTSTASASIQYSHPHLCRRLGHSHLGNTDPRLTSMCFALRPVPRMQLCTICRARGDIDLLR